MYTYVYITHGSWELVCVYHDAKCILHVSMSTNTSRDLNAQRTWKSTECYLDSTLTWHTPSQNQPKEKTLAMENISFINDIPSYKPSFGSRISYLAMFDYLPGLFFFRWATSMAGSRSPTGSFWSIRSSKTLLASTPNARAWPGPSRHTFFGWCNMV